MFEKSTKIQGNKELEGGQGRCFVLGFFYITPLHHLCKVFNMKHFNSVQLLFINLVSPQTMLTAISMSAIATNGVVPGRILFLGVI